MKNLKICALLSLLLLTSFFLFSCQKAEDVQVEDTHAEISQEETTASVPALNDLHEVIYQMWHSAFPEKDYALIKELLPQLASLTEKLDQAELPGILRDKKEQWDEGKGTIKTTLDNLHKAVDADNKEDMLSQVEAFHSSYERLVRTISPVVPELEAFHQELYKLYRAAGLPESEKITCDSIPKKTNTITHVKSLIVNRIWIFFIFFSILFCAHLMLQLILTSDPRIVFMPDA